MKNRETVASVLITFALARTTLSLRISKPGYHHHHHHHHFCSNTTTKPLNSKTHWLIQNYFTGRGKMSGHLMNIFYSPNKHGWRINNTNTVRTTQLQSRQNRLKLDSNLDTCLAHNTLGKAKPKYSWQYFTISIFLVVKSFMKNLLITKSRDCRSDLVKGHASRPYRSAGKHLTSINWRVTS